MSVTLPLNRHSIEMVVRQLREERRHDAELDARAHRDSAVGRLLFVADAAVTDVHELPPVPRTLIESATEVHTITCAPQGRRRGSALTVIAGAVADFAPDHILLALRGAGHHNRHERRLSAQIEDRFRLPVITYAVDAQGQTARAAGPLLLCFDGSADAARAIEHAAALFPAGKAILVTVWQQPLAGLGGIAWGDEIPTMAGVDEIDQAAAESAGRVAADGLRIAERAGLSVESRVVNGSGPISSTILELAERNDAAVIVMGSRGLAGLGSIVLGSVSDAVVGHADRPTLVIRRSSRPRRAHDHAA
jgi:nucleotide-binding universal stress UspA family protein